MSLILKTLAVPVHALNTDEAAVVIANLTLAVFNFTEQLFSSCPANRSQYKQGGLLDTYMLNKPGPFRGNSTTITR